MVLGGAAGEQPVAEENDVHDGRGEVDRANGRDFEQAKGLKPGLEERLTGNEVGRRADQGQRAAKARGQGQGQQQAGFGAIGADRDADHGGHQHCSGGHVVHKGREQGRAGHQDDDKQPLAVAGNAEHGAAQHGGHAGLKEGRAEDKDAANRDHDRAGQARERFFRG